MASLDINHYAEVQGIVRKAFEHQQVILTFSHTLHDRRFLAQTNILWSKEEKKWWPVSRKSTNLWITTEKPIAQQIAQSSSVEPAVFKAACKKGIGGFSSDRKKDLFYKEVRRTDGVSQTAVLPKKKRRHVVRSMLLLMWSLVWWFCWELFLPSSECWEGS